MYEDAIAATLVAEAISHVWHPPERAIMSETSTFLGIPGYRPGRYRAANQLVSSLGDELRGFVGETLENIWLMWEANEDEWFADGPVILGIGGRQIEVCAFRNDTLLVSLDAIDRSEPLDWCGARESGDALFDLQWMKNPSCGQLPNILGRRVRRIGIGEYAWELSEPLGLPQWLLVSVAFELEGAYFAIDNALDENGLRFEPPAESEDRRIKWITCG